MSNDLATFLLARIADDGAAAREANGRVAWLTLRNADGSMRYTTVAHLHHGIDGPWIADGHEITAQSVFLFYDSARVLAECDAKRRIVERHHLWNSSTALKPAPDECWTCETDEGWPCSTLRLLALPYADHPDFDPAWRTA